MIYKVTVTEKIVYDVDADTEDEARHKIMTDHEFTTAVVESMRIEKIKEDK